MSLFAVNLDVLDLALVLLLVAAAWGWRRARLQARRQAELRGRIEDRYGAELARARAEAERARRARTTFLAAANHDMRQPLQAAFCFSTLLAMRLKGRSRAVADHLQHALQVLSGHLEALVDLSRLDAGLYEGRTTAVALGPLFRDVIAWAAPTAAARGLELRAVDTSAVVRSDPWLLRRALENLVSNGLRFTEHGGVLVGARRCGASVRIEVWDSGVGIAQAHLDRVCEEFYQVGNPQRDRAHGLGLGLAVVERIMRLLPDHALRIRSWPGRGSVFALDLPLAGERPVLLPPAPQRPAAAAARPPAPMGRRAASM